VGGNVSADAGTKRFPLTEVNDAVALYQNNMTAGKVLLVSDPKVTA
jgi:hypothetical protein